LVPDGSKANDEDSGKHDVDTCDSYDAEDSLESVSSSIDDSDDNFSKGGGLEEHPYTTDMSTCLDNKDNIVVG
jgi:hypothetical protein